MTYITRFMKNVSHQSENAQPEVQSQRPPAPGGFGTERIAAFSDGVFAIAITLIATGFSIQLLWRYATHNHRLVAKDIDPNLVRRARRRNLTGPVICLAAIAVSFLNVYISLFFFILVPIFYISPGRIDQHW